MRKLTNTDAELKKALLIKKRLLSLWHLVFFNVKDESFKFILPINDQRSPSYRNQSIDLESKSIDWFLYDGKHWPLMG